MHSSLPSVYHRIVAPSATSDFRTGTKIESVPLPSPKANEVVVKSKFLGINASDVNFIAGRYSVGQKAPFYPGFECVGRVEAVGSSVESVKVGDTVCIVGYGLFAEYVVISANKVVKVGSLSAGALPILVGGVTASIALQQVGDIPIFQDSVSSPKQTVLVTAAAGATGHFAVQLAALAGCHVIGTCSSHEKAAFLSSIGCDRVINYRSEQLKDVLRKEYPNGIDVIFESVGGDTFQTCVNALAVKGKLIVIGFVSGYKDQSGWSESNTSSQAQVTPLPVKLLAKSASVRGFFLNNYPEQIKPHTIKLARLIQEGKLVSQVDATPFHGLESVKDAIDHLYSGKNIGKVVVSLDDSQPKL
eukprot:TRINITY_DN132_c0_g1_i4.p1 TRINITY_DN132_c0_g1~~TRINITY_DN132_c0_g1_i4.p1  ORF type:complete len:359 (-),score=59.12 TRINITY_DN132_c0_g1_i4:34-1110(-)